MADMIEILKSPENLRNICISLSTSLCLYAIIIHSSKGRISRIEFWKREGDVIGSIISKLNAFVVRNGSLLLDGKEIFVRSDGFSYRLVYDRNAHVPGLEVQERDCLAREYYNIPVSRSQLKKLLETSAGRPLVISPAR